MPRRRGKKDRSAEAGAITQNSTLLSLPPEIRNSIYELVCTNVEKAVVLADHTPYIAGFKHPLSRTCRQLHQEFAPVYRANAALCAH